MVSPTSVTVTSKLYLTGCDGSGSNGEPMSKKEAPASGPKLHKCALESCQNFCPVKNKYCSDEHLRQSRVKPQDKERMRLEDRMVERMEEFLRRGGAKGAKLRPVVKRTNATASDHEMLLMLSDAHYPEVVDPEVAMGLSYNPDVFERRLEKIRNVTIRYKQLRETAYPVRKLTVAMLGDMLSGDIHEELEVTNAFPTSEALVKLAYLMHDFLITLRAEFGEVEIVVIPGNHPRQHHKPRFKQKTVTNFEYILGHMIAALSQGAYQVTVPKDMVYVHKVFDWRVGMTHGDGVKSNSFAGIPFYGIRQRREATQALLRSMGQPQIDFLLLGHFHQPTIMEGQDSTVIINGAVKGGDEYSIGSFMSNSPPVQYLLTFHERHGLTDASRINLEDIR